MVALELAPSKDREIEGSSPLQSAFQTYLRNGCGLWPRRFSLRLPRLVRLSTDEAGSHLALSSMAASLLKGNE